VLLGIPGEGTETRPGEFPDVALGLGLSTEVPAFQGPLHPHVHGEGLPFAVREQQHAVGHLLSNSRQVQQHPFGLAVGKPRRSLKVECSCAHAACDLAEVGGAISKDALPKRTLRGTADRVRLGECMPASGQRHTEPAAEVRQRALDLRDVVER
jgi:hypothetical protein